MASLEKQEKNHCIRCDIVIPVYNAPKQVRTCLESVLEHIDHRKDRVIVVNDGSDEYTTRYLRSVHGIILLENAKNLGFLRSANRGLLFSRSSYVCLLNSDTVIVDPHWLDKMVQRMEVSPHVGLMTPLSNEAVNLSVKMHPGADIHLMAELIEEKTRRLYPDAVTIVGFCLLVRREVIDAIGGFDEVFGMGYCEESDYHYRAREAGFECKVADDVFIYHEGEASFSGERDERYRKNRALFDARWGERYAKEIQEFNGRNELGYLRADDYSLKEPRLHQCYDVIFLLPSFSTYGGIIVVVDIVNQLILRGMKANVVSLTDAEGMLEMERYFEPFFIEEEELLEKVPPAHVYVATHYRTVAKTCECAWKYGSKTIYFIQDDERLFEGENVPLADLTYDAIPNHVYVSSWLQGVFGKRSRFHRVIFNGVHRDLFYPRKRLDGGPGCKRLDIAMLVRKDRKRGYDEGMAAINRVVEQSTAYHELHFHFFGNREVRPNEVKTSRYTYYGVVSRRSVAEILGRADVLIDPSHFQGFGLTALEAMSSGCACILPRQGGTTDFVKDMDNGILFEGGQVDDLYFKLKMILDCEGLRERIREKAVCLPDPFDVRVSSERFGEVIRRFEELADFTEEAKSAYWQLRRVLLKEKRDLSLGLEVQLAHVEHQRSVVNRWLRFFQRASQTRERLHGLLGSLEGDTGDWSSTRDDSVLKEFERLKERAKMDEEVFLAGRLGRDPS